MPDPLEALAAVPGLSPRDAVIARALVKNKLVEAGAVLAAAREAARAGATGDLLDQLMEAGHLTPERAIAIEEALEKRIAQHAPVAAPEPRSTSKRGGRGRSRTGGTTVLALDAIREDRAIRERNKVNLFLTRYVQSRLHQLLLVQLNRKQEGIVEPKGLARATGASEKDIKKILVDWKSKGLFQTYGTFPFYYKPDDDVKKEIAEFMRAWNDPKHHSEMVKRILELERT